MDGLTLLKTRRMCRKFQNAPLPRRDLEKILHLARLAPSGGNARPWRVTILDTPEKIKAVFEVISEDRLRRIKTYIHDKKERQQHLNRKEAFIDFMVEAPVWVCFSYRQITKYLEKLIDPNGTEADVRRWHINSPLQSASAAVLQLLLAAHAIGYGGCWMCGPLLCRDALHKMLGIVQPWELMAIVPLGKPLKKSRPRIKRDALGSFVEFLSQGNFPFLDTRNNRETAYFGGIITTM